MDERPRVPCTAVFEIIEGRYESGKTSRTPFGALRLLLQNLPGPGSQRLRW